MLNIYFGYDTDAILSIDKYFDNTYDEDWLEDPFVKQMVADIDHSEVLDKYCIQSPVLGQILSMRLYRNNSLYIHNSLEQIVQKPATGNSSAYHGIHNRGRSALLAQ